ncbi:MAG: leucyl aminopeptidase [Gemmatimonadaceae bacterium]|nr:leucyl aminopeptidase [Gemmatimonadaceae bacterium]
MPFSVQLKQATQADAGFTAIALGPSPDLRELARLDRLVGGVIRRAIRAKEFRGGRDETLHLTGGPQGKRRVLLVGIGAATQPASAVRRAAAIAARAAKKAGTGSINFWAPGHQDAASVEAAVAGLYLGQWEYADLKTPAPPADRRAALNKATLLVADAKSAKAAHAAGVALGEGQAIGRRLQQMPGNYCTPSHIAETAQDIGKRHGLKVTVTGRAGLEKLGMGSFLCVAQGTPEDPKLITIEYKGGPKDQKPIALVGKGLCFDTGGISLKPAERMEYMKFDMSGAAGVLGAMEAIARLKLAVNVVGLIGSTTNMPSGTAVKPGDVVRAANGKTIEIINTDAEGRLVLADVLHHAGTFNPSVIVDAATLTGACVVALGGSATGLFANSDELAYEVRRASTAASEPTWHLPLWDEYKELITTDVADLKNSGGRGAGAITAAKFLQEFVPAGVPWAHLDIAGTAYSEADLTFIPKGPTGVPVGTFLHFVRGRVA